MCRLFNIALLDVMRSKSVSPNWVPTKPALCRTVVQDAQFHMAVHFNSVHIGWLFFIYIYKILYLFTSYLFNAEQGDYFAIDYLIRERSRICAMP